MIEAVAACDTGSQSTRCYLFDKDIKPLGSHQETLHMIHHENQPGSVHRAFYLFFAR